MAQRREIALVGVLVALAWGIGAALSPGSYLGGPANFLDRVSIWWYSAMLASLAAVAWLMVRLAPAILAVRAFAWLLAGAGVAGSIGNALEDAFHVPNAEYLYGVGLFGTGIALIGLTLALLWYRRWPLAALVAGTLAGIVVMAGHGPQIVPVLWLAAAAWASAGRRRAPV
jgi:hypothetical protein